MSTQNIVWVIDDDRSIRWVLEKAFKQAKLQVESFENAAKCIKGSEKNKT